MITLIRPSLQTRFLQLPPSCRQFHATVQPRFASTVLETTHTLIEGLHATGLSWGYVLPLTALTLRVAVVLPISIYTRRSHQKQLDLQPLLSAWAYQIRKDVMRKKRHLGPEAVDLDVKKMIRIKRRELYSRWGCGWWKNYLTFIQLPVWLAVMETIRGMCGMGKGLFGLILGGRGVGDKVVEEVSDAISRTAQDTLGMASTEGLASGVGLVKNIIPAPTIPLEPGFSTEGILWLTDLTAPDPLLLFPFMLSGAMFLNLMPSRRVAQSKTSRRLTNALRVVALAVGPLTLQMPSAMLLYWFSSSMFAFGQGILLDRFMPLKQPVKPCKNR